MKKSEDTEDNGYVLGLDLGVQSVGFAMLPIKPEDLSDENIRLGVRCFDGGSGSEDDFRKGKDESPNKARRDARAIRRNLWRRRRRLVKLFNLLKNGKLLPKWESDTPEKRQDFLNHLDRDIQRDFFADATHIENQTLPYQLRAKALDEKLTPFELGRVLYHLGQRRGFLSNKKAKTKESEDDGKVKQGISELQEAMEQSGCRTLGEYFASLNPDEKRIRQRWTSRKMFLDEFEQIWEAQAQYHPKMLDDKLKRKIHSALFFQRPLKIQKFLIGKCELEPGIRNVPVADLLFQRFRYWQRIIDLRLLDEDHGHLQYRSLTREEQDKLADAFENVAKLTFKQMRDTLGLKQPKQSQEDKKAGIAKIYSFNFELDSDDEKGIIGNRTRVKVAEKLKEHGFDAPDRDVDLLVREILQFENEEALARRLRKLFPFDEFPACQLAQITFESGYASLSRKAIEKVLPMMIEKRIPFATARKEIYGDPKKRDTLSEFLPPVKETFPSLKNPAVTRALTELRKVVNAIIRQSGKPARIRVELARDLKRSRKQREEIWKKNDLQNKKREAARKRILEETKNDDPRPHEILKFLLAEECNWECPYTGKTITPRALLGDSSPFDIEHIIPLSRSLDNSFANKTLCWSDENRHHKKNQTPFECYHGNPERWHEITERVKRFRSKDAKRKLALFLREEVSGDFAERMLNDTRYISRLAADYLGLLYGGVIDAEGNRRVQVSSGGMTAWLRDAWDLNSILDDGGNEKNRSDHRHHAVDAVVIALSDAAAVRKISLAAQIAREKNQRRQFAWSEIPAPTEDLLKIVRGAVEKINVSYRVNRKVSGAFHKETNYSGPQRMMSDKGKPVSCRHIRKPLTSLSISDVEKIVDPRIKEIVLKQLQKIGGNPSKFNESNYPMLETKTGRLIPIKKVRIRKNVATIPVGKTGNNGEERRVRYVEPGNNHHMEIIAHLDKGGNETKWEGVVVSLYEAYRRQRNHEPIVQRDHGPDRRFKFSLGLKEYFMMKDQQGVEQLYVVRGISNEEDRTRITYSLSMDARPYGECRIRKAVTPMRNLGIHKVHVDPLGNIRPAND